MAYSLRPMANGQIANLTYPHYLALRRHARTRGPAPYQHDFACEVLIEALRHGPLPVGQFEAPNPGTIAPHAQHASVSKATIFRAKKTLQVTSTKSGDKWIWTLPPTIPTLSLPPAIVEPKPAAETCAPCPPNDAQLLTPQSPAPLPTPTHDNSRTFPTPGHPTPTPPEASRVSPISAS